MTKTMKIALSIAVLLILMCTGVLTLLTFNINTAIALITGVTLGLSISAIVVIVVGAWGFKGVF